METEKERFGVRRNWVVIGIRKGGKANNEVL